MRRISSRKGFTLVECMLASAILAFITLALFEGVLVASRIARENADVLEAQAVAWDAAWKVFNEDFDRLALNSTRTETLTAESAPQLSAYDTAPQLKVTISAADEAGFVSSVLSLKKISADVSWGPSGRRKSLSAVGLKQCLFRSSLGRVN